MTPSQVSTRRCTFCSRTFLLKLARAQHTENSDRDADITFSSANALFAENKIYSLSGTRQWRNIAIQFIRVTHS